MSAPATFTFAVYPSSLVDGEPFDSFLLDVPTLQDEAAAARRAWWSVFHLLGPRGIEPEEFTVCCWRNGGPGPLVTSGGIEQPEHVTPWAGGWPA